MPEFSRWLLIVFTLFAAGCQSSGSRSFSWLPFRSEKTQSDSALADQDPPLRAVTPRAELNSESTDAKPAHAVAAIRVESLVQDGIRAIQEKRLDDAHRDFTEVLKAAPDHAVAHQGLAMIADLQERWSESEYHYKQALKSNPEDPGLMNDLGYSYMLQNRFHEASRYLNQALETNPQHEKAHENLAMLSLRQGNREDAEQRLASMYPAGTAKQHLAKLEESLRSVDAKIMPASTKPATTTVSQSIPDPAGIAASAPAVNPNMTFEEVQQLALKERQAAELARQRRVASRPESETSLVAGSLGEAHRMPAENQSASIPAQQASYPVRDASMATASGPVYSADSAPQTPQAASNVAANSVAPSIGTGVPLHGLQSTGGIVAIRPGTPNSNGEAVSGSPGAAGSMASPFPLAGLNAGPGTLFSISPNQQVPSSSPNPYQQSSQQQQTTQTSPAPDGIPVQHGVVPQHGILPQQGVPASYGQLSQHGIPSQYGVTIQHGIAGQHGISESQPLTPGLNSGAATGFPITGGSGQPGFPGNAGVPPVATASYPGYSGESGNPVATSQPQYGATNATPSSVAPAGISGSVQSSIPADEWIRQQLNQAQSAGIPSSGSRSGQFSPRVTELSGGNDPSPRSMDYDSYYQNQQLAMPGAVQGSPANLSGGGQSGNPMTDYQRQVQQNEGAFNQTLQQMDRHAAPLNSSQAQY